LRRKQIFISSVQREFAHARDKLASFINNDPYWSQFFYAFIFENLPASRRSPADIYLAEIDRCAITRAHRQRGQNRPGHELPPGSQTRHKPDKPDIGETRRKADKPDTKGRETGMKWEQSPTVL